MRGASSRLAALLGAGLFVALAAADALGCPLEPGSHERTLSHDGEQREYRLYVPAGCSGAAPMPLVVDLHGSNRTPADQAEGSGFVELADRRRFAVAFPAAIGLTWNAFEGAGGTSTADDVGFVRAVLEDVGRDLAIARERIYVTGHSAGAALAHRLACEASDVFAAAAPVSFSLHTEWIGCVPSHPIGLLQFHGRRDPSVPYEGIPEWVAGHVLGAPASAASWARSNGCLASPQRLRLGPESRLERYEGCSVGVEVGLATLGGGHFLYRGNNELEIDVASWAWSHLSAHTRVPEPSAGSAGLAAALALLALARRRARISRRR